MGARRARRLVIVSFVFRRRVNSGEGAENTNVGLLRHDNNLRIRVIVVIFLSASSLLLLLLLLLLLWWL